MPLTPDEEIFLDYARERGLITRTSGETTTRGYMLHALWGFRTITDIFGGMAALVFLIWVANGGLL